MNNSMSQLLNHILYLADWHYAIWVGMGKTITGLPWRRGDNGPYVRDHCLVHFWNDLQERKFNEDEYDSLICALKLVKETPEPRLTDLIYTTQPFVDIDMNEILEIRECAVFQAKIDGRYDKAWQEANP